MPKMETLAPNHGQKRSRGRPCRSSSAMTLMPFASTRSPDPAVPAACSLSVCTCSLWRPHPPDRASATGGALGLALGDLLLGVLVGALDQQPAAGPPERPHDDDEREADVPRRDGELLPERVGGRGGRVGDVAE